MMQEKNKPMNPMTITGFILGITGMFIYQIGAFSILAVVFSGIGLVQNKDNHYRYNWMAVFGLILGIAYTYIFFTTVVLKKV